MQQPYLSIIIPAYNEESRITRTLSSLSSFLANASYDYEVIVVSDGSTDQTVAVVQKHISHHPKFRLIANEENRGKGYAVKCGMSVATGDLRLFMDADNSVSIDQIHPFLAAVRAGADVVVGSIALGTAHEHSGVHRRSLGSLSKWLIQAFAAPGVEDTQRGFKLFTKRAAEMIFPWQQVDGFGFDIELLVIARENGLTVKELPVVWDNPAGSKVNLTSYLTSLRDLITIVMNRAKGLYRIPPALYPQNG